MLYAFEMDVETAELFYKLAQEHNLDKEQRIALLLVLGQQGKLKRVSVTNRTREEYVKDLRQHFKVYDTGNKGDICELRRLSGSGGLWRRCRMAVMRIGSALKRTWTSSVERLADILLS